MYNGQYFYWLGIDPHWLQTGIFFAFFVTCLAEKIGFHCTNKACQKKISAHRLAICISLCAAWVCSSDLQPTLWQTLWQQ